MACNTRSSEKQRRMSLVEEVTCGTTPTSPVYNIIPHLSGSGLRVRRSFERTEEIDSGRQGGKLLPGVIEDDGPIILNIANEVAFDKLMESAIGAALTAVNLTVTVTFAASGKTATRASGSFLTDSHATRLKVGDKVAPAGSSANRTAIATNIGSTTATSVELTDATAFPAASATAPQWALLVTSTNVEFVKYTGKSSNTLTGLTRGAAETTAFAHTTSGFAYPVWTISAIAADAITFTTGSDTVADQTSVSTTFYSNRKRATAGTTRKRFTVETYQADVNEYKRDLGCEVNTAEIAIGLGQGRATFGMIAQNVAWTQASSSTYTAKRGSNPQTGTATGTLLTEDGSTLSGVYEATISINNGRARQNQLGTDEADHISEGDFDVTVQMSIYHSGFARVQAHLAGTASALVFRTIDATSSDKYQFTLPRAKKQDINEGQQNNTITEPMTIFAEKDDVSSDGTNSKMIFEKIYG